MVVPATLLPELEQFILRGTAERRAEALCALTTLFVDHAAHFTAHHIALFSDVFTYFLEEVGPRTLAEFARRLAPLANAPVEIIRRLACNDDIEIAAPVLQQGHLSENELLRLARTKSQAHLLAISSRAIIDETLSDILITRGDRTIARAIATNTKAKVSETAFAILVRLAEQDNVLAETLVMRTDVPSHLLRGLLTHVGNDVQKHILVQAISDIQPAPEKLPGRASADSDGKSVRETAAIASISIDRSYSVEHPDNEQTFTQSDIAGLAIAGEYEKTIDALAAVCAVPWDVVDRLMRGHRIDSLLILGRSAGFNWAVVSALIGARPGLRPSQQHILDAASDYYHHLAVSSAQRVVRFWQASWGERALSRL